MTSGPSTLESPDAVILAGGEGTRLQEHTRGLIPKPMVEIGSRPMLSHIIDMYLDQRACRRVIVATGYLHTIIDDYVAMARSRYLQRGLDLEALFTGDVTQTGGRLRGVYKKFDLKGPFMATYGDGLSDINFRALVDHHRRMKREHHVLVTLTAVRPPSRFGSLYVESGLAKIFEEKVSLDTGWINGGFYVIEPEALEFVVNDSSQWEYDILPILAHQNRVAAYQHPGWWQMCDTPRDLRLLEEVYEAGNPPWRKWHAGD